MANPQNIERHRFPKGVSGNPKGRPPKGAAFAELIALIEKTPGSREALAKVWLKEMLRGNFQFYREYLDRSDGKPVPIADEPDADDAQDTGILVRVPTVRQAERIEKAKARKTKKTPAKKRKKLAGGSADGAGPG